MTDKLAQDASHDTREQGTADVTFRRVETLDEYRQCEDLQTQIWGPDDVVGVPLLDLLTAQENGGAVIGAFMGADKLIGFVYSFPGLTPTGGLKQCSIILAVDPSYQGMGIGHRLKMAQCETALEQGISLITWTFDPLMARNANLNVRKLGAIARTYIPGLYGEAQGINAGLDTDRLLVEWRLDDPAGGADTAGVLGEDEIVNPSRMDEHRGFTVAAGEPALDRRDPRVLVEIPYDIARIKSQDMGLASEWQRVIRDALQAYFACGYVIRGFTTFEGALYPRPCYVLYADDGDDGG